MKKNTTRNRALVLAVVLVATLCLALPAAAKDRPDTNPEPNRERVEEAPSLPDLVLSFFERLRVVLTGGTKPGGGEQMPGSSMDPDGHRPSTH